MEAVYSLGKLPSKYLILTIIGFACSRTKAGTLLMGASRKLRRLLEKEFLIFKIKTVD
jgi:hypothetical protein